MKNYIFVILLLQIYSTTFSQNHTEKVNNNSLYIYVEKSNLKNFKLNRLNFKNEIYFKLSWPTCGNFKKNILKKDENGLVKKWFDFIIGRSYNLQLKSNNKYDCINQKKLITQLKNNNVLYFNEFNLYDIENLMGFLNSDIKIYLIYNDFKRKVKVYECFVVM